MRMIIPGDAINIREDIKRIRCPTLAIGIDTARRG
jgi:hypothetical protein